MNNSNHGDGNAPWQSQLQVQITQVSIAPEQKLEYQLQEKFAGSTGIWCGKPAREWLERLMDCHGFTGRELGTAWRGGSIGWMGEENQPRISTPLLEATLTRFLIGWAGLYCFGMAVAFLLHALGGGDNNKLAMLGVAGAVGLFLAVFWMGQRYVLLPRRVALRVRSLV